MEQEIVNKVANSGLITIDLEELVDQRERVAFDIKAQLFQGLLLREKEFRIFIAEHNWEQYRDKHVAVFCSTDAILPKWAFMLVAQALQPIAETVMYGTIEQSENMLYSRALAQLQVEDYRDKRIVVKGCGDKDVPTFAYVELTRILTPVAKSIMYGEPCSTVPVFKRK
jgi:hypothetical protein